MAGEGGQQGGGGGQQAGGGDGGQQAQQASGDARTQGGQFTGQQQAQGDQQQGQQGDQQGQQGQGDQQPNDTPWNDPERARREIERLRRERGDERQNAKRAAADEARKGLLSELQRVLDPAGAEAAEPLTIERATTQLATLTTERDGARTEADRNLRRALVAEEALRQGVDPKRLGFLGYQLANDQQLAQVEVSAESFAATLQAAVSRELTSDPSMKAQAGPVRSGAEGFSGPGQTALTKAQFDALSYNERLRLFQENRSEYDRLVASQS